MRGTVKWFSKDKGHSFIHGEAATDYFFHVSDVIGAEAPRDGDMVEFDATSNNRGPRAAKVRIVERQSRAPASQHRDDRVECIACKKKMVPRIITHRGRPERSVCPYCAATFKRFGMCFIASAVYGDYDAPEVLALRGFRDNVLRTTKPGRWAIRTYYRVSPPLARFLHAHPKLAQRIKPVLDVVVRSVRRRPHWTK
ncbi:CFI-box-CTERM domain-containing protein [Burkholderia sp. IDO3]|uniref:cold-shock protein n=1 Tax=Burkholderia sp. IDO3 TaxID=1705310 RepID=UPI000BBA5641|nr:CFI-box-CTERM domain-containing protein [Burkholderia sp. IDO3]AXK67973.1 cold shock domain-containing protein [Burkholderia sp. IDO3]PCD59782.1 cold-shock protein [Burkholderia sp. IDO3]